LFRIGNCTNVPIATQLLITSFINNITLSNRTIVSNGPTPEDRALNYLISKDATFKNSQLLTLNSTMTNKVQFRIRQRYALLTLWFQPAFTNTRWYYGWLVSANECYWRGISCASINLGGTVGTQNVVTAFVSYDIAFLNRNDMKGTIPADLGLLTAMEIFNATSNSLTGTLPASIIQWTALLSFGVPSNELTGTLPASIGQWTALTRFDVGGNALTGTLPASIGQWTALTYFGVPFNELTGTLPASIGQWTALTYFAVPFNELIGTLPASIGQWTALTDFAAYGNALTGTLPASVGQWTALTFFSVSKNALTGTLPASIGNWSQIIEAFFYKNNFTGTLPNGICPYIANGDYLEADCVSEITCTCCTGCY
jgi:hypothetical protein